MLLSSVTAYYGERIEIEISQGKRYIGPSSGMELQLLSLHRAMDRISFLATVFDSLQGILPSGKLN